VVVVSEVLVALYVVVVFKPFAPPSLLFHLCGVPFALSQCWYYYVLSLGGFSGYCGPLWLGVYCAYHGRGSFCGYKLRQFKCMGLAHSLYLNISGLCQR
jgi:hypothetical protein